MPRKLRAGGGRGPCTRQSPVMGQAPPCLQPLACSAHPGGHASQDRRGAWRPPGPGRAHAQAEQRCGGALKADLVTRVTWPELCLHPSPLLCSQLGPPGPPQCRLLTRLQDLHSKALAEAAGLQKGSWVWGPGQGRAHGAGQQWDGWELWSRAGPGPTSGSQCLAVTLGLVPQASVSSSMTGQSTTSQESRRFHGVRLRQFPGQAGNAQMKGTATWRDSGPATAREPLTLLQPWRRLHQPEGQEGGGPGPARLPPLPVGTCPTGAPASQNASASRPGSRRP